MRLVSWNCRSGFHRKLESLATLAPDIAIVSECASLEILARKVPGLRPTSAVWVGSNPHKGLGVFSFGCQAYALGGWSYLSPRLCLRATGQCHPPEVRRRRLAQRVDRQRSQRPRAAHQLARLETVAFRRRRKADPCGARTHLCRQSDIAYTWGAPKGTRRRAKTVSGVRTFTATNVSAVPL